MGFGSAKFDIQAMKNPHPVNTVSRLIRLMLPAVLWGACIFNGVAARTASAPLPVGVTKSGQSVTVVHVRYEGRSSDELGKKMLASYEDVCPAVFKKPLKVSGPRDKLGLLESNVYMSAGVTVSYDNAYYSVPQQGDPCEVTITAKKRVRSLRWNGKQTQILKIDLSTGKQESSVVTGKAGLLDGLAGAPAPDQFEITGEQTIMGIRCQLRRRTSEGFVMESCLVNDSAANGALVNLPLMYRNVFPKGGGVMNEMTAVEVEPAATVDKAVFDVTAFKR
jgi:hypothetical protein